MGMNLQRSKWASRFIAAAIVQGALATALTLFIVIGQIFFLRPEPSRVIAFGSAGQWFTVGYLTYLIVGVIGMAVTALFYHYIESVLGKPFTGLADRLAGVHLLLMNIGVVGATWLMMLGGYLGGASMLPPEVGGRGWNPGQVHVNVFYAIPLGYPLWISVFIIILAAGVLAGGLSYITSWRQK
jgi:heme/copper-type cytochrome/quinol oxidase subunit 1